MALLHLKGSLTPELRRHYDESLQLLAGVFARGIRKGLFQKGANPYYLAVCLDSLTNAFLFLWLEDPQQHPYQKNLDHILTGFLSNITPATRKKT